MRRLLLVLALGSVGPNALRVARLFFVVLSIAAVLAGGQPVLAGADNDLGGP